MTATTPTPKVWVTRDEPADGPLCAALRRAGLEPVCEPVIERHVTAEILKELESLQERDWLVLTSTFAVEAVPVASVRCRVAVVGDQSRAAAAARGLRVGRVSPDGTGRGLWQSLRSDPDGAARVCYARSSLAEVPPAWEGMELSSPVLYHTTARRVDPAVLRGVRIVAVASPSAVPAVVEFGKGMRCASIGPTTSAALRSRGLEPWVEPAAPSFEALAAAIAAKVLK